VALFASSDDLTRYLWAQPQYADLVSKSYFDADVHAAAERFYQSAEFQEVLALITRFTPLRKVLDLGAGRGIATYSFWKSGAECVYALEPDPGDIMGRGAIARLVGEPACHLLPDVGEAISLPDASVGVVYARQVLHHASDLPAMLNECARVLEKGGVFLASREHVVTNERQRERFLAGHALHRFMHNENAYTLAQYVAAFRGAGLTIQRVIGPWDSVINYYPCGTNADEVRRSAEEKLRLKLGALGTVLSSIPGVVRLAEAYMKRPSPGRLFTFLARK
jgi:ubiquinone/menaquinone biosynthesis C-methylase UbiE